MNTATGLSLYKLIRVGAVLRALAVGYLLVNRYHHMRDPTVGKYDYRQALHACRDRFTPLFAHRHDRAEVAGWLRRLGFVDIEDVDWRTMPSANQANYRRNTGIRARRDTRSAAS